MNGASLVIPHTKRSIAVDGDGVLAAQIDSPIAFQNLYALYASRLYKSIFRITRNAQDAEDALQDTFLRAYLAIHTFAIGSNCARHQCKNRHANICFWLNLTIFRMNSCTKRVRGWGCRFSAATSTLLGFGCRPLRFQGCGFSIRQPWAAGNCTPDAIALQCRSKFG